MRRSIIISILLIFLLVISGCTSQKLEELDEISAHGQLPDRFSEEEASFSIASDEDVYVLPVTEIALIITNTGTTEIGFGEYRTLERLQEDVWYEVPSTEQFAFGDIGLGLEPGNSIEQEMPLEYLNYELTPGTYRIVKPFRIVGKEEEIVLGTQFEIEE